MEQLALTVRPSRFETPTSYLSRVAAWNFCSSLMELCLDVGLNLTLLSTGSAEALSQVAQLAGLQPGFFDHTVIIKTSSMKYRVGDEAMDTETLARGDIRVCPRCVADKLADGGKFWDVVHHHHWQVRQIRRCVSHGCFFLQLKPKVQGNIRLDATYLIRQNIDEILHAAAHSSTAERADEIDTYLSRRVYGHKSSLWCEILPIPALYRASEALGTLLLHDRHTERRFLSQSERRRASLRGFRILADGPQSIRDALGQFTNRNQHNSNGHSSPQYGDFQRLLRSDYVAKASLEPLRDVVLEYFLDTYPLTPRSEILGRVVPARRIHSMRSAIRELGVRQEYAEEMFIERGIGIRGEKGKFKLTQNLPVELVSEMKQEHLGVLNEKEAVRYLGASSNMFKQLKKQGVLTRFVYDKKRHRRGFNRYLLDTFLHRVFDETHVHSSVPPGTRLLAYATRCAKCTVADIIRLILEGKLQGAGRLSETLELKWLPVDINALKAALPAQNRNGYTMNEALRQLFIDRPTLLYLLEHGFLKTQRINGATSRVANNLITLDSYEAFRREYCTLGMLQRRRSEFRNLQHSQLRKMGVEPFVKADGIRRIYRMADLPDILTTSMPKFCVVDLDLLMETQRCLVSECLGEN